MSGADELRQLIGKHGAYAPEAALWRAWEALPGLLDELDEDQRSLDWYAAKLGEAKRELRVLRSAARQMSHAWNEFIDTDVIDPAAEALGRLRALTGEAEQ